MNDPKRIVILGVGNLLKGDDGVGVRVIEALERGGTLPPGVELVDGGTGGPTLMTEFAGAAALIIVDAGELGAAPGTVREFGLDDVAATNTPRPFSLHDVGVMGMIDLARQVGELPAAVRFVVVQPERFDTGDRLSAAVAGAVERAAEAVRTTIIKVKS
jgi:hydrogenase maturation protease